MLARDTLRGVAVRPGDLEEGRFVEPDQRLFHELGLVKINGIREMSSLQRCKNLRTAIQIRARDASSWTSQPPALEHQQPSPRERNKGILTSNITVPTSEPALLKVLPRDDPLHRKLNAGREERSPTIVGR